MSLGKGIGGFLVALAILYLLFDFFFWNGGLVDPAIIPRIERILGSATYSW